MRKSSCYLTLIQSGQIYGGTSHFIYHLLAEKKISLDDDIDKIDLEQADHQKVRELFQMY
jgi:hypothetical protein